MFRFNPADYPKAIQRQGLPYTSAEQAHILKWLHDPASRPTEQPFKVVVLKELGLHSQAHATLKALVERDWIIASTKVFAEVRYQITPRGVKALKLINQSKPKHRADDLCSRCRERPRKQYPSVLYSYCQECINAAHRKTRRLKGNMHDPNKLCSSCRRARRQIGPTGHVYSYCKGCLQQQWRADYQRKKASNATSEQARS